MFSQRSIPLTSQQANFRTARPRPVHVAPLSRDRTALFHALPQGWDRRNGRVSYAAGPHPLRAPLVSTQLDLVDGTQRNVLLLNKPARELCSVGLYVRGGADLVATLDPDALQSPITDPLSMLTGLTPKSSERLLRMMMTTGASLLAGGALEGFERVLPHLLSDLSEGTLDLVSLHVLGSKSCIGRWRLDPQQPRPEVGELIVISNGRVKRVPQAQQVTQGDPRRLDLVLSFIPPPDSKVIAFGDKPVVLSGPRPGGGLAHVNSWFRRSSPAVQRNVLTILGGLERDDATAASQRIELACPPAHLPRAQVHVAASTRRGLLYMISLVDPMALAEQLRFSQGSISEVAPLGAPILHPRLGPVHIGYIVWDEAAGEPGTSLKLDVITKSQRILPQNEVRTTPYEMPVPEVFSELSTSDAGSALAAATHALVADRPFFPARPLRFGPAISAAALSICITPGTSQDYLRAALTAVVTGAAPKATEVIVLLRSEEERQAQQRSILDLQVITGLTILGASYPSDALDAEMLRGTLEMCQAKSVIWLSQGVLPLGGSWGRHLHQRVVSARRPRLVTADAHPHSGHALHRLTEAQGAPIVALNQAAIDVLRTLPQDLATAHGTWAALRQALSPRARQFDGEIEAMRYTDKAAAQLSLLERVEVVRLQRQRQSGAVAAR